MRKILFPILVIAVALASVPLSEIATMTLLEHVSYDATGNYFWRVIMPAELFAVGIASLLLMMVYRTKPVAYLPLYAVVFCAAHATELNMLHNPAADILAYMAGILIACAVWFSLLWKFYLSRQGSG